MRDSLIPAVPDQDGLLFNPKPAIQRPMPNNTNPAITLTTIARSVSAHNVPISTGIEITVTKVPSTI